MRGSSVLDVGTGGWDKVLLGDAKDNLLGNGRLYC